MPNHSAESYIGDNTPAKINFDYQPCETPTLHPVLGFIYPGCDAEIQIAAVLIGSDDVKADLSAECLDRLTMVCWEKVKEAQGENQ